MILRRFELKTENIRLIFCLYFFLHIYFIFASEMSLSHGFVQYQCEVRAIQARKS